MAILRLKDEEVRSIAGGDANLQANFVIENGGGTTQVGVSTNVLPVFAKVLAKIEDIPGINISFTGVTPK